MVLIDIYIVNPDNGHQEKIRVTKEGLEGEFRHDSKLKAIIDAKAKELETIGGMGGNIKPKSSSGSIINTPIIGTIDF